MTQGDALSMDHWFDGFSQVHRFELRPSSTPSAPMEVSYNSRRIVDKLLENARKTGKLQGFSFGQKRDPCQSFFKKVMSTFEGASEDKNVGVTLSVNMPGLPKSLQPKDSVPSGHVSGINIKTLTAKTDANAFKSIDPTTLEPIGVTDQTVLHPDLKGQLSGAHAKSDPKTGDVYNYNLLLGPRPSYRVFHTSASTGKTDILATIIAEPAYLHSIFLTEKHVVLCVWNSLITKGGATMLWTKNIMDAIEPFDAKKKAKWYVVDRINGKGLLATYTSPAFFAFHTINAWTESSTTEGEEDIVLTIPTYPNLDILHKLYYNNLLSTSRAALNYVSNASKLSGKKGFTCSPTLKQYRLPRVPTTPRNGSVSEVVIDFEAPGIELPTINPRFFTKPNRYTYGVTDVGRSTFVDGLSKFDAKTRTHKAWWKPAQSPGEAIFIPDPEGKEEDAGVLLSVVLDGHKGTSYLLCLDASTMEEIGRASVPGAIAFGFHGVHVSGSGMASSGDT